MELGEDVNLQSPSYGIPRLRMEFDSEEDAYDFYNSYAAAVGFSVRKEYGNRNSEKVLTSRRFTCTKEGKRRSDARDVNTKRPRAETKTGCGARMGIILNRQSKKYVVSDFVEEHNHQLHVLECRHLMLSQRKINEAQQIETEVAEDAGLSISKMYDLMVKQAGGAHKLGCTREDIKRHLRTRRERSLKYGEAGNLMWYFRRQVGNNPNYFYTVQLDCEEQITNIFWADAQMRVDYSYFGDVVTFDTTYRTNREYRPLGVFIGFNHHRQMVVFGAALLYDETVDSFAWLFESFLEAMADKHPRTIFTDQDAAMAAAMSRVMPETYHGLCTFHIKRNFVKHLANHFKTESSLYRKFMDCMHWIEEDDDFDKVWAEMTAEHSGAKNKWLSDMYELRHKWARCHTKEWWTAGMRSTQLSESFNSEIKAHLKSDHNLFQFFNHFCTVVGKKRQKELAAEYEARQKLPRLCLKRSPMLNQAASIYTPAIFEEFQNEFDESSALVVRAMKLSEEVTEYSVGNYEGGCVRTVSYYPSTQSILCSCNKFHSDGILCAHCIKVLDKLEIKVIHDAYIMKRWTREARDGIAIDTAQLEIHSEPELDVGHRYRLVGPSALKVAARAARNPDATSLFAKTMNELSKKVEQILSCSTRCDDGNSNLGGASATQSDQHNSGGECRGTKARGIKKRTVDKAKKKIRSWTDKLDRKKYRRSRELRDRREKSINAGTTGRTPGMESSTSWLSSHGSISVNTPLTVGLYSSEGMQQGDESRMHRLYAVPTRQPINPGTSFTQLLQSCSVNQGDWLARNEFANANQVEDLADGNAAIHIS